MHEINMFNRSPKCLGDSATSTAKDGTVFLYTEETGAPQSRSIASLPYFAAVQWLLGTGTSKEDIGQRMWIFWANELLDKNR